MRNLKERNRELNIGERKTGCEFDSCAVQENGVESPHGHTELATGSWETLDIGAGYGSCVLYKTNVCSP